MKKLLAILLVVALVVPMCLVMQVEGAGAEIRPYYVLNGSPIPETVQANNVFHLFSLSAGEPKADDKELVVVANDHGIGNDIVAMAAGMKGKLDALPAGTRYMMITIRMDSSVEKWIFLDKGTKLLKDYLEKLYSEFKKIGGQLDGLVVDMEYDGYSAYNLDKVYQDNLLAYKTIMDDPRYQEKIRPILVERGFQFWKDVNDFEPELFSISSDAGDEYAQSRSIWDAVMHEQMVGYMNDACSPLFKYFPDANLSNYRSFAAKGWLKTLDNRGSVLASGGSLSYVGNTTNENACFSKSTEAYFNNANKIDCPVGYNNAYLAATKFNALLWDLAAFKNMMQASDTEKMFAWVAGYDDASAANSAGNSPYYTETLLHIGMMNPLHFLGYVSESATDKASSLQILSDIMTELTRVGGAADRKYIVMPYNWNSSFALTGMYAGGRNIWRITPDTTYVAVEKFKVEGKDPTFKINGQTITFPGGKIVENGKIAKAGTCGYWVETPTNVMPVITSDADRYKVYPAFQENFNGYQSGMEYAGDNVKPVYGWQIEKGQGATALVQEDKSNAGNKVLALTGDLSVKNIKVPKNVTAGDTYAEDQTWEVTVTIPANMGAEAEAVLLAICNDRDQLVDGGFKIAGGKLYYSNAGDYVEFKGVNVSAGGKFTFKRTMDFNTAGAFNCDYTVYGATGKVVTTAKNVPVGREVKIPVPTISMEFVKIAGDPILLDDYKLYASGVATDLEVYDAKLGMLLTEQDKARAADTAYRLSWMNATDKEQTYSIVAAYYNGNTLLSEKVVKEIKMAPGTDAVETGVISVENGQAVRVYIRNNDSGNVGMDDPFEEEETVPSETVESTNPSEGVETTNPSETVESTNPSESVETTSPSGGVQTTEPSGSVDGTVPSVDAEETDPSISNPGQPDDEKKGLSGGAIAAIAVGSAAVLAVGGFCLCWFVIKPKWLVEAKWFKRMLRNTEETE